MNILLIHPKLFDGGAPRLPLGLGYIAVTLRASGYHVSVLDLNVQEEGSVDLRNRIKNGKFEIFGLSAMLTQFKEVKRLSALIREISNAIIVLGGGLASAVPEIVLSETRADIAVIGEGERTIVELASKIERQQGIHDIAGIAYRSNGEIKKTPPRPYIDDLSSIPMPAWDLFPIDQYFKRPNLGIPTRRMSVITSRGCPYQCSFCFHGIFGHRYRSRSAENVVAEIEMLSKKYRVRGIHFEDDTFILEKRRIYEICDLLVKKNLNKLLWTCNGRVNLIDGEMLRKMRAAGCVGVNYGVESGNQALLDTIDKQITIDQVIKAVELTRQNGMSVHCFLMLGMPGETYETVRESVELCKRLKIQAEFSIATPIPGSSLFSEANAKGKIRSLRELVENWGDCYENVLVNLSDIESTELLKTKKKIESEVYLHYIKKNWLEHFLLLAREIKINGMVSFLTRILKGLRLLANVSRKMGLTGLPHYERMN